MTPGRWCGKILTSPLDFRGAHQNRSRKAQNGDRDMAKRTSNDSAEMVEQTVEVTPLTRGESETVLEFAARAKAHAAEQRAKALAEKPEKAPGSGVKRPSKPVDEEAIRGFWHSFQQGQMPIDRLTESLHIAGLWNDKEAATVYMLSSVDAEPATQKQVAEALGCNTWMVYNYRRDALSKLGAVVGIDWETLHEPLSIRRGAAKPERSTQYWPQVSEEEKKLRAEAHAAEVAARKEQRTAERQNKANS